MYRNIPGACEKVMFQIFFDPTGIFDLNSLVERSNISTEWVLSKQAAATNLPQGDIVNADTPLTDPHDK